ncbi:MAG: copper-translocating P-type ATPase, partial [Pseudomonadota bacterium]
PYASQEENSEEKSLIKYIAVAGFASGNIMLFSFALWFASKAEMGEATRDLLHWASAIIALPAIIYSGRPYFSSAYNALKHFRTNMDVPISLAVILASAMSLFETIRHGEYVYFDSSVMLLFLLLIGRYFDRKARGRAKAAAQDLLAMMQGVATIREGEKTRNLPIRDIMPEMILLVAVGEKIAADGVVIKGYSEIDTSLLTGETIPVKTEIGQKLFAGTINISAPLEIKVSSASEQSMLADIVRLMENSEQSQAYYVRIADKVAGWYTPVVHILAAFAFLLWIAKGLAWQKALMIATTVLIVTCPCALGLAVPVVQVVASGRLFRKGMMLKSGDALERLAVIDTIVFDKTGTLTIGKPQLIDADSYNKSDLQLAASLAAKSKHPLSRAISDAWKGDLINLEVSEESGNGLKSEYNGKEVRLGRRAWCGDENADNDEALEIWLNINGSKPIRFTFADVLRPDAVETINELKNNNKTIILLSGDRERVVRKIAGILGIDNYHAAMSPIDKTKFIEELSTNGKKTFMVGDGLNDAPALAAANVSISPSSGMDITQNAADIVFQGSSLSSITEAIKVAKISMRLVKQNFALSFFYNIIAVPVAIMGYITPLLAAIAMSSSSIIVVLNALRLNKK